MKKPCSLCKTPKDLEEFNRSARNQDGRQSRCRECSNLGSRQHFEKDPEYYRQKTRERHALIQDAVNAYKEGKPCMDCGRSFHPCAMDFDHRDPEVKRGSIGRLVSVSGWSLGRILEEIAKCDLICANCHRIRTYHRAPKEGYSKSSKQYA